MTGVELANEIEVLHPHIQVLLTTGYSEDIVGENSGKYMILKKPFTKGNLAAKLQEISCSS